MMQPAEPRHGNDLRRHHGAELLAGAGLKLPCLFRSRDLQSEFPVIEGFSPRGLKYMRARVEAWPEEPIVQQAIAQLSEREESVSSSGTEGTIPHPLTPSATSPSPNGACGRLPGGPRHWVALSELAREVGV